MPTRSPKRATRALLIAAAAATLTCAMNPARATTGYIARPEVLSFMHGLHTEWGFELSELERIIGEAQHIPAVVRLIAPDPAPGGKQPVRSYPKYRAKFLTPARISAGVRYWQAHESDLHRAESEFGVPAEVILGILGVETAFGRNTGSYRVIDVLATIAFDSPRRQEYFREELKELLLLARDIGLDPLAVKGSYAGAMGLPQFMPSSYRRYAVDFDGDGRIDLVGSPSDAIGSIASYLKAHGWSAGEPATVPVTLPESRARELVSGLARIHTVADLKNSGVKFSRAALPDGACSIVELPRPGGPSKYVAGFGNFGAITSYNRSTFYASAVLDLAAAIRAARITTITAKEESAALPAS